MDQSIVGRLRSWGSAIMSRVSCRFWIRQCECGLVAVRKFESGSGSGALSVFVFDFFLTE